MNRIMQKCIARINGQSFDFQLVSNKNSVKSIENTKNFFGFSATMFSKLGTSEVWVEVHHNSYKSLSNDKRKLGNSMGCHRPAVWIMTPKPEMKEIFFEALDSCPLTDDHSKTILGEHQASIQASSSASLDNNRAIVDINVEMLLKIINQNYKAADDILPLSAPLSETDEVYHQSFNLKLSNGEMGEGFVLFLTDLCELLEIDLEAGDAGSEDLAFLVIDPKEDSIIGIWNLDTDEEIFLDTEYLGLENPSDTAQEKESKILNAVSTLLDSENSHYLQKTLGIFFIMFIKLLSILSKSFGYQEDLIAIQTLDGFPLPDLNDVIVDSNDGEHYQVVLVTSTLDSDCGTKVTIANVRDASSLKEIAWPPVIINQTNNIWTIQ